MSFENAKRIARNSEARVASSASGIYDDNLVLLYWENIEAKYIEECLNYFNDSTQRVIYTVDGTVSFYDVSFTQDLYHLHTYYSESDERLYRILMKEAATTSTYTQTGTKWRTLSGQTYESGTSNLVLVIYNVHGNNITALTQESLPETITDDIYLIGGTQLTGTWYNIRRESEFNTDTGLYDLKWFISKYNSKEYIFHSDTSSSSDTLRFFLHHATEDKIEDFENKYYFDSASIGDYYYSTDGTNYTKKNNNSESGLLSSVPNAKRIIDPVVGRTVDYKQIPNRENGEIDFDVTITFSGSVSLSAKQSIKSVTSSETTAIDTSIEADSLDTTIPTPSAGTTVEVEITPNQDGTFNRIKKETTSSNLSSGSKQSIKSAITEETTQIDTSLTTSSLDDTIPTPSAGTIVEVEINPNEDGTFNRVKRERSSSNLSSGSKQSIKSATIAETTQIDTAVASSSLTDTVSTPAAGTVIEIEISPNEDGTFNRVRRERSSTNSGTGAKDGFVSLGLSQTIEIDTAKTAAELESSISEAAGVIQQIEIRPNGDGTYTRFKRVSSSSNVSSSEKASTISLGLEETMLIDTSKSASDLDNLSVFQSGGTQEVSSGETVEVEINPNEDGTFTRRIKKSNKKNIGSGVKSSLLSSTSKQSIEIDNAKTVAELQNYADIGSPTVGEVKEIQLVNNEDGTFSRIITTTVASNSTSDEKAAVISPGQSVTVDIDTSIEKSSLTGVTSSDLASTAGERVEIDIRPNADGTFSRVKRKYTTSNINSGSVEILKNNAQQDTINIDTAKTAAELASISALSASTGQTHQIDLVSNNDGTFSRIHRTINKSNVSSGTITSSLGTTSSEEITIDTLKTAAELSSLDSALPSASAGTTKSIEVMPNDDGTFRRVERTVTDVAYSGTVTEKNADGNITELTITENSTAKAFGSSSGDITPPAQGEIKTIENIPLPNGLFKTTVKTETMPNLESDLTRKANGNFVVYGEGDVSITVSGITSPTYTNGSYTKESSLLNGKTQWKHDTDTTNNSRIGFNGHKWELFHDSSDVAEQTDNNNIVLSGFVDHGSYALSNINGTYEPDTSYDSSYVAYKHTSTTGVYIVKTSSGWDIGSFVFMSGFVVYASTTASLSNTSYPPTSGWTPANSNYGTPVFEYDTDTPPSSGWTNASGTTGTASLGITNFTTSSSSNNQGTRSITINSHATEKLVFGSGSGQIPEPTQGQIKSIQNEENEDGTFKTTLVEEEVPNFSVSGSFQSMPDCVTRLHTEFGVTAQDVNNLFTHLYFTDSLDLYKSTDGTNTSEKNGSTIDTVTLTSVSANNSLSSSVRGVTVDFQYFASKKDPTLFDVQITLKKVNNNISICKYTSMQGETVIVFDITHAQPTDKQEFLESYAITSSGDYAVGTHNSSDNTFTYTEKNGLTSSGTYASGNYSLVNSKTFENMHTLYRSFYNDIEKQYTYQFVVNIKHSDKRTGYISDDAKIIIETLSGGAVGSYSMTIADSSTTVNIPADGEYKFFGYLNGKTSWFLDKANFSSAQTTALNSWGSQTGSNSPVGFLISFNAKLYRWEINIISEIHHGDLDDSGYNRIDIPSSVKSNASSTSTGGIYGWIMMRSESLNLEDMSLPPITTAGTSATFGQVWERATYSTTELYNPSSTTNTLDGFNFMADDFSVKSQFTDSSTVINKPIVYSSNKSTEVTMYDYYNLTQAQLQEYSDYFKGARFAAGSQCEVKHKRSRDGTYELKATILNKKGTVYSFDIGLQKYHIGNSYPQPPYSCDPGGTVPDGYYKIEKQNSGGVINGDVTYNEKDDSWDWTFTEEIETTKDWNAGDSSVGRTEGVAAYLGHTPSSYREVWMYMDVPYLPKDVSSDDYIDPDATSGGYGIVTEGKDAYQKYFTVNYDVEFNRARGLYNWRKTKTTILSPRPLPNLSYSDPDKTGGFYYTNFSIRHEKQNNMVRQWAFDSTGGSYTPNIAWADSDNLWFLFLQSGRSRPIKTYTMRKYFVCIPPLDAWETPNFKYLPDGSEITGTNIDKAESLESEGKNNYYVEKTYQVTGAWQTNFSDNIIPSDLTMRACYWNAFYGNPNFPGGLGYQPGTSTAEIPTGAKPFLAAADNRIQTPYEAQDTANFPNVVEVNTEQDDGTVINVAGSNLGFGLASDGTTIEYGSSS